MQILYCDTISTDLIYIFQNTACCVSSLFYKKPVLISTDKSIIIIVFLSIKASKKPREKKSTFTHQVCYHYSMHLVLDFLAPPLVESPINLKTALHKHFGRLTGCTDFSCESSWSEPALLGLTIFEEFWSRLKSNKLEAKKHFIAESVIDRLTKSISKNVQFWHLCITIYVSKLSTKFYKLQNCHKVSQNWIVRRRRKEEEDGIIRPRTVVVG